MEEESYELTLYLYLGEDKILTGIRTIKYLINKKDYTITELDKKEQEIKPIEYSLAFMRNKKHTFLGKKIIEVDELDIHEIELRGTDYWKMNEIDKYTIIWAQIYAPLPPTNLTYHSHPSLDIFQ